MATEVAMQVHDTLPKVLKASGLYYKSKNYNMHSYKSHPWKRYNKWGLLRGD